MFALVLFLVVIDVGLVALWLEQTINIAKNQVRLIISFPLFSFIVYLHACRRRTSVLTVRGIHGWLTRLGNNVTGRKSSHNGSIYFAN
jgi:hypothetical protein